MSAKPAGIERDQRSILPAAGLGNLGILATPQTFVPHGHSVMPLLAQQLGHFGVQILVRFEAQPLHSEGHKAFLRQFSRIG